MIAEKDWLWDRKISLDKAKEILRDPSYANFLSLSSLLLSRKNSPGEVFKAYLKPKIFLQNWLRIKRQMRRDYWNNPRIEYWQAIYEKLREKYNEKGMLPVKKIAKGPEQEFMQLIYDRIRSCRKQKKLTQRGLAKRLKISQQMISHIEGGEKIFLS